MAIPSSELVTVTPRVLSNASSELEFNGLFLTKSDMAPVDTLLTFYNASGVGDYFGYDSSEYRGAVCFFNGYENSLKKPSQLYIFRHVAEPARAYLRGASISDEGKVLAGINEIQAGNLSLLIGGDELELTGLNLTKATSMSDAALIIQDAIRDYGIDNSIDDLKTVTVEYLSLPRAFVITAGVASPDIAVFYATGDIAEVMGLTSNSGALLSPGSEVRTYSATLDKVLMQTGNFVSITTAEEVSSLEDADSLASWVNNQYNSGNQFLYMFYTTDAALDVSGKALENSKVGFCKTDSGVVICEDSGREIAENFLEKAYEGVAGVYGTIEYAAFFMGMAACINWDNPGSTITFAFKRQAGLSANVTSLETARALEELKLNFVGDYASRNDNFVLSMHGAMYGAFGWIDTYINSIWLNNALQVALLGTFKSTGRIPYNNTGSALLSASCLGTLNKAVQNGVIESGITLSDTQKNQLMLEAGADISQTLATNGYYLKIDMTDASARQQRTSPVCNLWYTFGGAVHKLNMPVTTVS